MKYRIKNRNAMIFFFSILRKEELISIYFSFFKRIDHFKINIFFSIFQMVNSQILILFILSLTITIVMCQTFTYSHGWTNGKRSTSLEELANRNAIQSDNVFANCELQKLRLLFQGNINNQVNKKKKKEKKMGRKYFLLSHCNWKLLIFTAVSNALWAAQLSKKKLLRKYDQRS